MARLNNVDICRCRATVLKMSTSRINISLWHFVHRTSDKPNLQTNKIRYWYLFSSKTWILILRKNTRVGVCYHETCGKPTRFAVISGNIQSPPLISKETLTAL